VSEERTANITLGSADRFTGRWLELAGLVEWMDSHLDGDVADTYQGQPLAQDWARVAKVTEEAGEAIDALIGITGQNPRKGHYGTEADLHDELLDVALTGLYALQHFTKDIGRTMDLLIARARYHHERVTNGRGGDDG
jgi:NTP pyrophosphatase (non-canonical NTP hydrolase)